MLLKILLWLVFFIEFSSIPLKQYYIKRIQKDSLSFIKRRRRIFGSPSISMKHDKLSLRPKGVNKLKDFNKLMSIREPSSKVLLSDRTVFQTASKKIHWSTPVFNITMLIFNLLNRLKYVENETNFTNEIKSHTILFIFHSKKYALN